MTPVTYGYGRVSRPDDATRNPETQLHVLQDFGIREEHIFTGGMTGRSLSRPTTPCSPFSAPSSYLEPSTSTVPTS